MSNPNKHNHQNRRENTPTTSMEQAASQIETLAVPPVPEADPAPAEAAAPAVDLTPKVKESEPTALTPEQEVLSKMTRKQKYLADRSNKPVVVTIAGQQFLSTVQEFSTGSVGYNINGKIIIDGQAYQVGLNLTAVKSKEW